MSDVSFSLMNSFDSVSENVVETTDETNLPSGTPPLGARASKHALKRQWIPVGASFIQNKMGKTKMERPFRHYQCDQQRPTFLLTLVENTTTGRPCGVLTQRSGKLARRGRRFWRMPLASVGARGWPERAPRASAPRPKVPARAARRRTRHHAAQLNTCSRVCAVGDRGRPELGLRRARGARSPSGRSGLSPNRRR